jgi:hypothetical protein
MDRTALLSAISSLATTHATVLSDIRTHVVAGQAGTPYDPSRLTFAGATLSPAAWRTVGRIELKGAEVDALISTCRRELSNSGDALASAVAAHQGTPQRIAEAMANVNADIASITAALALKSVSFSWSLLSAR